MESILNVPELNLKTCEIGLSRIYRFYYKPLFLETMITDRFSSAHLIAKAVLIIKKNSDLEAINTV